MTTTEWTLLTEAHESLLAAVQGADDSDWDRPTPCESWTVTQVLQHAVGDQIAYAAAITGGEGPSEDPFAPSGVLSDDPVEYLSAALKATADAWSTVARDTAEVPVPVPPKLLDAETGVGACALDAAVHAWDITKATGQPPALSQWAAGELLPVAERLVEPLRAYGAYAPALDPREDDDTRAALLRYLGRDPEWTA